MALWAILAGDENSRADVQPDYRIAPDDLPSVALTDLSSGDPAALETVRGKQVVFTALGGDNRPFKAPGRSQDDLTSAHISVIAAETAKHGGGKLFSPFVTVPLFALTLLLLVCAPLSRLWRRVGYAVWTVMFAVSFALAAALGHRIFLADPMVIALAFGAMRAAPIIAVAIF